jgi:hypothetical protein
MNRKQLAAACRWLARIVGALLVVFIVVIAIGEGMPNPFAQPAKVQVGFLALAMMMMGILAGWRWELAGGILSLAGWCLFCVPIENTRRGLNWFCWALMLPGALYLTSALLRGHNQKHP